MRMRERGCAFVLFGLLACAAPACAMPPSLPRASPSPSDPPPSFDQVRQEIDSLITRVADVIPEPKEVVILADGDPLSCSDPLVGGHGKGSVYTGRAKIYVDPATDISELVNSIPPRLGEGWVVVDLGLDLNYPETYVQHRTTPWMDLSVDKILHSDRTGISLSAISRCGVRDQ